MSVQQKQEVYNKTVKVVEVLPAVKGYVTLKYLGPDGAVWKTGNLLTKLSEHSRETLKTVKEGDLIPVNISKVDNYWTLVAAGTDTTVSYNHGVAPGSKPSNKAPYTQPQAYSGKSKETDTRIQVMNALTNAIVSLGSGKTTEQYKKRVVEFVTLGNEVVDSVLTGKLEVIIKEDDVLPELGF